MHPGCVHQTEYQRPRELKLQHPLTNPYADPIISALPTQTCCEKLLENTAFVEEGGRRLKFDVQQPPQKPIVHPLTRKTNQKSTQKDVVLPKYGNKPDEVFGFEAQCGNMAYEHVNHLL